jgi:hypothetical protein
MRLATGLLRRFAPRNGDYLPVDYGSQSPLWGRWRDRLAFYRLLPATMVMIVFALTRTAGASMPIMEGSVRAEANALATGSSSGEVISTVCFEMVIPSAGKSPNIGFIPPGYGSQFHPASLRVLDISNANSQASSLGANIATNDTAEYGLIASTIRPFCWAVNFLGVKKSKSWARCPSIILASTTNIATVSTSSAPNDQSNSLQPLFLMDFSRSSSSKKTPAVTPIAATTYSTKATSRSQSIWSEDTFYVLLIFVAFVNFGWLTVIVWRRRSRP